MLYALDQNNNKIRPTKGIDAKCLFCFDKVIAACGQINIHHWRHDSFINCDPWKEHETEWHRQWKEEFPENWREIIITSNDEKHIADIQTESGLVLELQNSSISSTTIQIRENFYGKMVWLINASHFSDNFSIQSLVKSRLRYINTNHEHNLSAGNFIDESLEYYYEKIKKIDDKTLEIEDQISRAKRIIADSQNMKDELDETVGKIASSRFHSRLFYDFKSTQIETINGLDNSIDEIKTKHKQLQVRLSKIDSFPVSKLDGFSAYREIEFNNVLSSHYSICKVIEKVTLNSFFPQVLDIRSELEFSRYSYSKDKYLLIIDLSANRKSIIDEMSVLEKEKESIFLDREYSVQILKNEALIWLDELIDMNSKSAEKLEEDRTELIKKKEKLLIQIEENRKILIEESIEQNKKLIIEKKSKEAKIMQDFKGQYSYIWKYRRKTWDFANCTLFLDFGTHIFQMVSEDKLIKMSHEDFKTKIKNWR